MIIKHAKAAILPAIAALTVTPASLSAEESASAMSLPSSEFAPMQRYNISYQDPEDIAEFYLRTLGLKMRDADVEEGRNPRNPKHKIVIATVKGINDPTVNAIQWRLELKSEGGYWEAVDAGLRRKCSNGPNANQWTRELCPS